MQTSIARNRRTALSGKMGGAEPSSENRRNSWETDGTLGKQTKFKRTEILGLRKAGVTRKQLSEEETSPG